MAWSDKEETPSDKAVTVPMPVNTETSEEEEDKKEDGEEGTSKGAREEGTGQGPREEEKKKEDKMGCEEETTGATEGQEHARL